MKKYLLLAATAGLLASCAEKPGYEVTGKVIPPDFEGKYIYMYAYGVGYDAPLDSALIQNGTFIFKGTQATPVLRVLRMAEKELVPSRPRTGENEPFAALFVLENAKLQATIQPTSLVKGTLENDALSVLQEGFVKTRSNWGALTTEAASEDKALAAEAEKKLEAIDAEVTAQVKAYIQANGTKQTAAKLLFDFRYQLSEEERGQAIAQADSAFKAVPGISEMIKHLEILKTVAVGKPFIDFEMADPNGKMRKLSDYVGTGKKVVLIDFWASWCPPCRRDMPALVELYKEYKNKNFEIVGVSLDNKADAWAKGVKDLNITWPQLSDLQGWKNAGSALYGVNSIPHTVLVAKDGTIAAKNLHGDALKAKLEELLK